MRYWIAVVLVMVLVVSAEAKEKPKAKKKALSVKIQENAVIPSDVIAEKTITDNVAPNPVTAVIIEDNAVKAQDNVMVPKKEEVCQVKKEVSVRDMSPRDFDLYIAQLTLKAGIEFGVLRPDMQIGQMSLDHFDLVLKQFKLKNAQERGIIPPGTDWKQLTQELFNKMNAEGIQKKGILEYVLPLK